MSVWTERVVASVHPDCIVLCGSYARGTYRDEVSDVDVLVVGGLVPSSLAERFALLLDLADGLRLPLEPLAYTRSEFEAMVERGHVGAYDALAFGRLLWGPGPWQRWVERFDGLKREGLQRAGHAWRMPAARDHAGPPGNGCGAVRPLPVHKDTSQKN